MAGINPATTEQYQSTSHGICINSEFRKFRLTTGPNQPYSDLVPSHTEGRLAIVTNAGRDAVDAGGAKDEGAILRTAKACGPDFPTLESSLR
jgi:hypothetical protein